MNKLLLLIPALVLILCRPATAQTTATHPAAAAFSRWSLSLESGPSSPIGAFHKNSIFSSDAGSAKTGIGAELATTYRFCPSFGLALETGIQQNPSAATPVFIEIPGPFNGPEEAYQHKSWNIARLLAGPVYEHSLSENKRLALRIRAMAGVLKTNIPNSKSVYVSDIVSVGPLDAMAKYSGLSLGSVYQADAGFKYAITRRISVLVNAGYTGSRFTGRYSYNIIPLNGSSVESGNASRTIALGTIQCRAGIDISL